MPDRGNPLSYNVVGEVRLAPNPWDERRLINELVNEAVKADQDRTSLLDEWSRLTKLRYGIRKDKTFPWRNAANMSVPYIDHAIRKFKPMLMNLFVQPDPIVEFVGEDPQAVEAERMAEVTYNWLSKVQMNMIEPMTYVVDYMCHRGFGWAQVGWEYQTAYECRVVPVAHLFPMGVPPQPEFVAQVLIFQYDLDPQDRRIMASLIPAVQSIMAGAQFVKLSYRRAVQDRPAVWDRDPVQIITPPRCLDYPNAEWLVVQHILSVRALLQKEYDGFFLPGSVNRVANLIEMRQRNGQWNQGTGGVDSILSRSLYNEQQIQDEREKIFGVEDESNVMIWEIFHWSDHNGDGIPERVTTYVHPRSLTKLCTRPFTFPFHAWPFVKYDFEKTTRRLNSPRGISNMLKHLQKEINHQHNARLDSMTLRNAPVYQTQTLANWKPRNFRVIPGTVLQLPPGAKIEPIISNNTGFPEQVNEENMLRSIGETYIGIYDANLTSPTSQTRARTATEIQVSAQYAQATASLDGVLFQLQNRQLHEMIWQIFMDLSPPEIFVRVPGADPRQAQSLIIRKSDINKKFSLIPTGTLYNTNRALELANAREALQLFLNDQTGLINPHQLRQGYFQLLDYRWARRILNSPDQPRELQILQAGAAAPQDPEMQAALGMNPNQGQQMLPSPSQTQPYPSPLVNTENQPSFTQQMPVEVEE